MQGTEVLVLQVVEPVTGCLAAKLRPGNVHSAEDWDELAVAGDRASTGGGQASSFPGGRGVCQPEIYEALEERGVMYAIRIPANDSLELDIAELLTRPVGRPSHKPVVRYKAFSTKRPVGKTARRVVAKVGSTSGSCSASWFYRHEPEPAQPGR